MRRLALIPLVLLGVALFLVFRAMKKSSTASKLRALVATSDPSDRWAPLVCAAVADRFGDDPAVARACMAIVHNESGGIAGDVIIGDATLGGGPSVGPMQVYRTTAKALGLWAPPPDAQDEASERDAYGSVANDPATCIGWGVAVFEEKLAAAHGDLADAVRRYNGGGTAAAQYRDRAVSFAAAQGWGELA